MINRLIEMSVPKEKSHVEDIEFTCKSNYSISDYAICFLKGMTETQQNRFKLMLENHIECGMCVARSYGIDYEEFIDEVKKLLKVGE